MNIKETDIIKIIEEKNQISLRQLQKQFPNSDLELEIILDKLLENNTITKVIAFICPNCSTTVAPLSERKIKKIVQCDNCGTGVSLIKENAEIFFF